MKPKTFVYLTILLVSILLTSCDLEDLLNPAPKQLLSKIYYDGNLSTEYLFDDDFKLTGRNGYLSSGKLSSTTEYQYNSNEQLTRINYLDTLGAIKSYELNEFNTKGLLVKRIYYYKLSNEPEPKKISSHLYEYNTAKKCIKYTMMNENDEIRYYTTLEYTGSNCTKENIYSPTDNLLGYLEYEYDTKKRPYLPLPDIGMYVNNITHLTSPSVNADGRIEFRENNKTVYSRYAFTATLTYTQDGYPETVFVDYVFGNVKDEQFEYEYITR